MRTGVAGVLIVHWLLAMAMAASPALHERLHTDAGHDSHECAAKLLAAGTCDAGPTALIAAPPLPPKEIDLVDTLRSQVFSSHRYTGVLEHAPPRRE